jgi:hypothetical protein
MSSSDLSFVIKAVDTDNDIGAFHTVFAAMSRCENPVFVKDRSSAEMTVPLKTDNEIPRMRDSFISTDNSVVMTQELISSAVSAFWKLINTINRLICKGSCFRSCV